jgi:hypothetical protein
VTADDFETLAAQRGGRDEDESADDRTRLALQSATEPA